MWGQQGLAVVFSVCLRLFFAELLLGANVRRDMWEGLLTVVVETPFVGVDRAVSENLAESLHRRAFFVVVWPKLFLHRDQ